MSGPVQQPAQHVAPATGRFAGRKLIVFLCMHRTGSSLAANVLSQLGMSLGPFPLVEAAEANPHGHFESVPFHALNRELQQSALGFSEDLPESADTLRRFVDREGRWGPEVELPASTYARARRLVEELVLSGPTSGFKDPRTLLVWPFWQEVLSGFDGLEVVPLFLVRSPHEIAMSVFARSEGAISYFDALEATAVHFRRMVDIRGEFSGPCPVVCFEPRTFAADLAQAAEACGLRWCDEVFAAAYDAGSRHHESAVISHVAQHWFCQLRPDLQHSAGEADVRRIERDAAQRESSVRSHLGELRSQFDRCREENAQYASMLEQVGRELATYRHENRQYHRALQQCGEQLEACARQNRQLAESLAATGVQLEQCREENRRHVAALTQCGDQLRRSQQEAQQCAEALAHREREMRAVYEASVFAVQGREAALSEQEAKLGRALVELRQRNAALELELDLIKRSRTWRFREMVVARLRAG